MFTYEEARAKILTHLWQRDRQFKTVNIPIHDALGYILAENLSADRDYPPFHRSTRDGYAVRAAEAQAGASLQCAGELKAGDDSTAALAPNTCIQIMTGAAIPPGADAVVMVEHTTREADTVHFKQNAATDQNIVQQGSEAKKNDVLLTVGTKLGYAELSLAAQVGATTLRCAKKPRVAILSTGDEIVPVDTAPGRFQIRNSNSVSLAAQIQEAGGEPVPLSIAADQLETLRKNIQRGMEEDILVLSGGVSMGKYDLVEEVLKEFHAQIIFDAVAIRPGKPAVFAMCENRPIFGLPGNPISTMVTFNLFVAPAIALLSGAEMQALPLLGAVLAEALNEKPGITHFLPALTTWKNGAASVRALSWKGSGDIAAMAKANCFLVVPADVATLSPGESVNVWMRKDAL